jgi:hypothetical protein
MYGLIIGLAMFVAASYLLIDTGGSTSTASAREVSVHDLTQSVDSYVGEEVTTTGRLTFSEEHQAYQITDDGNFAIIIRDFSDEAILLSLQNKEVRVTGIFGSDAEDGTFIQASAVLEVLPESPS